MMPSRGNTPCTSAGNVFFLGKLLPLEKEVCIVGQERDSIQMSCVLFPAHINILCMLLSKSLDLQVSQFPIPCSLCQALTLGKHGTHFTSRHYCNRK